MIYNTHHPLYTISTMKEFVTKDDKKIVKRRKIEKVESEEKPKENAEKHRPSKKQKIDAKRKMKIDRLR